jgi:hypothetical protein
VFIPASDQARTMLNSEARTIVCRWKHQHPPEAAQADRRASRLLTIPQPRGAPPARQRSKGASSVRTTSAPCRSDNRAAAAITPWIFDANPHSAANYRWNARRSECWAVAIR